MVVTNCKGCGRLFNSLSSGSLCPDCLKRLDEKFNEVRQYLDDYPNASISEVSEECEVSVKQIKKWIKEERLSLSEGSIEGVECEVCGTLIRCGRYCDSCRGKIANNLSSALDKPKPVEKKQRDSARMRFLDN